MMQMCDVSGGLYFHVPFCVRKCPYCDFYSVPVAMDLLEAYTDTVCRNLKAYAAAVCVDTIYFGGGTPSLLSSEQLGRILSVAAACFSVATDAEVTLEANPATLTKTSLRQLHEIGVNRLSVGVQSLDDNVLSQLGRLHTAAQAVQTIEDAAQVGFSNLSCDLMLATPGQTAQNLKETIEKMTALPIQHISAYLLKIEPGTPFAISHIDRQCPDEDTAAEFYLQAVEQLERFGFLQYEISNFAKPGFQSRHNCKYWRCEPYLGIGPSAHSCWNGKRFFVPPSLPEFLDAPVQQTKLEDESPGTLEECIMLGMRLTEGVPEAWLAGHSTAVERFCKAGFLRHKAGKISFTPKGFLVSNSILAELL